MTASRFLIAIILTLGTGFTTLPAEAQSAARLPRVGYLGNTPLAGPDPFADGLRALGWIHGRNVIIERRFTEGNVERAPQLAAELVGLAVDVIVAAAPPNVRAVQRADILDPGRDVRRFGSGRDGLCREPGATRRQHHRGDERDPRRLHGKVAAAHQRDDSKHRARRGAGQRSQSTQLRDCERARTGRRCPDVEEAGWRARLRRQHLWRNPQARTSPNSWREGSLALQPQGRHRYFQISSPRLASAVESLSSLSMALAAQAAPPGGSEVGASAVSACAHVLRPPCRRGGCSDLRSMLKARWLRSLVGTRTNPARTRAAHGARRRLSAARSARRMLCRQLAWPDPAVVAYWRSGGESAAGDVSRRAAWILRMRGSRAVSITAQGQPGIRQDLRLTDLPAQRDYAVARQTSRRNRRMIHYAQSLWQSAATKCPAFSVCPLKGRHR